jgi:hypothetical protein
MLAELARLARGCLERLSTCQPSLNFLTRFAQNLQVRIIEDVAVFGTLRQSNSHFAA